MKIQKAEIGDIQEISRIHALSWKVAYRGIVPQAYLDDLREDFWIEAFQSWMEEGQVEVQMAFDDDHTAIGCAAYGPSRDASMPDYGEIISIYLMPDYFGKGVGFRLMEQASEALVCQGYTDVYLWVLKENQRARKFYEKLGFISTEDEITCEILGKELIDIRYVRRLSQV